MNETLKTRVADARAAVGSSGEVINATRGRPVRYELFHGSNSICSQKVRSVLAHHSVPYASHQVNMFLGQTYLPDYVRLRMIGCDAVGGTLVAHHSGSTSAAAGCDGVVVPTLVDWQTGEVVVDSKRICLHLDDAMAEPALLRPPDLSKVIDHQLGVVDHMPNYQMLMGRQITSESGATSSDVGEAFSRRKVAWCDHYIAEHATEATLVQAYTAKRAKELSAATALFAPAAMRAAYDRAQEALIDLERTLAARHGEWLFGDRVSMADLFWTIELLRMKNMGVAIWERGQLRHVDRFVEAGAQLPAIRAAIIDWPGAMF